MHKVVKANSLVTSRKYKLKAYTYTHSAVPWYTVPEEKARHDVHAAGSHARVHFSWEP